MMPETQVYTIARQMFERHGLEAVQELAEQMLRNAYGLERPPADASSRLDLRAYEALRRIISWLAIGPETQSSTL